jgi:hypothetical protein
MEALTLDSSKRTISKEKEFINGPMEEDTKENGKTTKWKVMVSSPGLMVEDMKEST